MFAFPLHYSNQECTHTNAQPKKENSSQSKTRKIVNTIGKLWQLSKTAADNRHKYSNAIYAVNPFTLLSGSCGDIRVIVV